MSNPPSARLDMPGYDPRDFVGYGRNPPHPQWPGNARIAVQIALNYEAGGERNVLHGDPHSEDVLADGPFEVEVSLAPGAKCARCWVQAEDVGRSQAHPALCGKCVAALG